MGTLHHHETDTTKWSNVTFVKQYYFVHTQRKLFYLSTVIFIMSPFQTLFTSTLLSKAYLSINYCKIQARVYDDS